jgi:hypothetical protein
MPLAELLDELFRLYRRHFSVIAGISLLLVVPGLLTSLFSGAYRTNPIGSLTQYASNRGGATVFQQIQAQQAQQNAGWAILGALIALIIVPFSVGALYRAAVDGAKGQPMTITSVLRETLARYWRLFGFAALGFLIVVLWVIALVIGTFLLVLPGLAVFCAGVYLAVRWCVSLPAMMAEDVGPIRGLGRSWYLVKGMWWRTLGIILIVIVAYIVIDFALLALFGVVTAIIPAIGTDARSGLATAATTLVDALVAPLFPIVLTLLYFDLRVRKEGLDLDQLAQQTSPGPAPA